MADDWRLRTGVEAILRHHGHSERDILIALDGPPHTPACEFTSNGWQCMDEWDNSHHPLQDEAAGVASDLEAALTAIDAGSKHSTEWAVWWGAGDNPRCELYDDVEDALLALPLYDAGVPRGVEYRDVTRGQWVTTKTLPASSPEGQ